MDDALAMGLAKCTGNLSCNIENLLGAELEASVSGSEALPVNNPVKIFCTGFLR